MTARQKAAATGRLKIVKFRRHNYEIDPEKITIEAYEALGRDDGYGFVKAMLGDEQFSQYKARCPLLKDVQEMSRALVAALGNTSASSSSSKSTARPSKPTS